MGVIETVTTVVSAVKKLHDLSNKMRDVEAQTLIVELQQNVVQLKREVVALDARNLDLEEELHEKAAGEDFARRLQLRAGAYYFSGAPPDGQHSGPYSTHCFDKDRKLITLQAQEGAFQAFGKFRCPSCKSPVRE